MPCLGRENETIELLPRLREAAGYSARYVCISDGDASLQVNLAQEFEKQGVEVWCAKEPMGYWRCLSEVTQDTDSPLIVNLANDLLPGRHWLKRAVEAYAKRYGEAKGIIGFNDGVHAGSHAAHFLISSDLLHDWYGDAYWPTFYHHNFGDTEICQMAIARELFAVAPFAVLYHNHPVTGGKNDDVYAKGMSTWTQDQQTFEKRKRLWQ